MKSTLIAVGRSPHSVEDAFRTAPRRNAGTGRSASFATVEAAAFGAGRSRCFRRRPKPLLSAPAEAATFGAGRSRYFRRRPKPLLSAPAEAATFGAGRSRYFRAPRTSVGQEADTTTSCGAVEMSSRASLGWAGQEAYPTFLS